jgi:type IV pilus assembly protein PilA
MIVGLVLAGFGVIMIPIVAILAAIAIPQYQEHVTRTKVQEGIAGVSSMLSTIETYAAQNGACPDNAALGLGAGDDGRFGRHVSSVSVGAAPEGACQVTLSFGTLGPTDQTASTLIYRQTADGWDCTGGSLAERYRPNQCRTAPR